MEPNACFVGSRTGTGSFKSRPAMPRRGMSSAGQEMQCVGRSSWAQLRHNHRLHLTHMPVAS
eukprot:6133569-Lingulodinium_polyedra.AAC.1